MSYPPTGPENPPSQGFPYHGGAFGQPDGIVAQQPHPSGYPMPSPEGGQPQPPESVPQYQTTPMSVPPYQAAPMSGPPHQPAPVFGPPMSGPPGPGTPYPAAPAPADASGRGRMVAVLAVVAGLLLVTSGLMTGLFITQSNEAENRATLVAERETTIASNEQEIERLEQELQVARQKVEDVEQDLAGTRTDRDEQERQKRIIARCLEGLAAVGLAPNAAARDDALREAERVCSEAEDYL